jgi:catechol-2,3-dioxygenase
MAADLTRRHFLGSVTASGAWLALHDAASAAPVVRSARDTAGRPRILSIELQSGAPLAEMKAFYGKALDFGVIEETADTLTVEGGETRITFVKSAEMMDGRAPFYHFAFNIPENKILQALEWQKARTPMLPIPERNRAAGYPPEVVDYRHWNAHSIFFLDPAGNVVEYIARHDLKNGDSNPFAFTDILYASEIALVVDDVEATASRLADVTGVSPYRGGSDQFRAMGDEYGLVLVMKRGRVIDFTSNPHNAVRVYKTGVTLRGPKTNALELADYPYRVSVEERCSCA